MSSAGVTLGIVLLAASATPGSGDPVVADLRGEPELLVSVERSEPPIRCVYRGDDDNQPLELACYRPTASQPFQRIDLSELETPYYGAEFQAAVDMNRDGHDDLRLLGWWGATGNEGYVHYLWDSGASRFVPAPEYSVCRRPTDERGCCTSRSSGGMAGNLFVEALYCAAGERLVEVERVEQAWDDGDRCFHRTTSRREDGRLQEVATEVVCDPAWP